MQLRARGSKRASAIVDTQREAIDLAKELNPDGKPDVSRVKEISNPRPTTQPTKCDVLHDFRVFRQSPVL